MTISEVSKITSLSNDTLRYYEKIGLIPPIQRTESGIRNYLEGDVKRVNFVKCLRAAGVEIEALTRYFELLVEGEDTEEERKNILIEQREKLFQKFDDMRTTIEVLDGKIASYEDRILKAEEAMKSAMVKQEARQ